MSVDPALELLIQAATAHRETFSEIVPEALDWTEAGAVAITFSDGAKHTYDPPFLRAICPCAECRGTHGTEPKAFQIITPAKMQGAARQTVIERAEPVGHYGMAFHWGDGHKEGIYTWSYLRGFAAAATTDGEASETAGR